MERHTKERILAERKEIEQAITALLKRVKSDHTLKDVQDAVYNETGQNDMAKIASLFDTGEGDAGLEEVLELVTSAWNHFPHRMLNGKSPQEMALERHG